MSYRFIAKATITVTPKGGQPIVHNESIRAYPAPKRPASGQITVGDKQVAYQRTGGKGRGLLNHDYLYFPFANESAYIEITREQAIALTGGAVCVITPQVEQAKAAEPVAEPVEQVAEPVAPEAPKAKRRGRK